MKRRRRLVLQSLAAGIAPLATIARATPLESGPDRAGSEPALRALLDTLIPADGTPAASALGIGRALIESVRRNEDYRRLVEEGMTWLDRSARALGARSFAAATEAQRIAVVRQAERADAGTLPRRLFDQVRFSAMRLYYARPAAWAGLSYAGPPQPAGFPDFEHPPAARK
jgi:hypothetical protein